jgi:hypothetical protein
MQFIKIQTVNIFEMKNTKNYILTNDIFKILRNTVEALIHTNINYALYTYIYINVEF